MPRFMSIVICYSDAITSIKLSRGFSQPSHAANLVTDHPMQWNGIEAVAEQEK